MKNINFDDYLNGKVLYGDDFSIDEITQWYNEEQEGYYELLRKRNPSIKYKYIYNAMNEYFGYRHIKEKKFPNVLGFGSSFGHEFIPIINYISNLTIIEPSDNMISKKVGNIQPVYIKPNVCGKIDYNNDSFDLITSFGVLHHIPNVTYVLDELYRILKPGGYFLLREPIRTMGDWRQPREGLTKNERGIPLSFFENHIKNKNYQIINKSFCDSLFWVKILNKLFEFNRDKIFIQMIDDFVSRIFSFNLFYHPIYRWQKISPGSIYYVLMK